MPDENIKSIEALSVHEMVKELTELRKKKSSLENMEKELVRARELLIDADRRFFYLVENIPDIVYVLDSKGQIRFISNSIIQYGYSPEELTGKNILDIVHPDDISRAMYRINERRTGERSTHYFEIRIMKKNMDSVSMEVNSKKMNEVRLFSISAEGRYTIDDEKGAAFNGTIGVARDLSFRTPQENSTSGQVISGDGKEKASACGHKESSLTAICSTCKKIRDNGVWKSIEDYYGEHYGSVFTHTICNDCMYTLYRDMDKNK
jgi:PAS domain S-box-containing protein